jgi:hypothetical protein
MTSQILKFVGIAATTIGGVIGTWALKNGNGTAELVGLCVAAFGGVASAFTPAVHDNSPVSK